MTRCSIQFATALLLIGICLATVADDKQEKQSWNFDDDEAGQIAKGFKAFVGKWVVAKSDDGQALAQTAMNSNPTFNITLVIDTNAKDVDLSVKMKAIDGKIDQGGGLVWRAQDDKNYYLARYNPLEDNYRLYKVISGKRTLLQNADITHSDGWHTLRITMSGDSITCYYDGKKHLEHNDDALPKAGMIGLWTKADAQSHFDALSLSKPE